MLGFRRPDVGPGHGGRRDGGSTGPGVLAGPAAGEELAVQCRIVWGSRMRHMPLISCDRRPPQARPDRHRVEASQWQRRERCVPTSSAASCTRSSPPRTLRSDHVRARPVRHETRQTSAVACRRPPTADSGSPSARGTRRHRSPTAAPPDPVALVLRASTSQAPVAASDIAPRPSMTAAKPPATPAAAPVSYVDI
jgi:hypothetical protein